MNLQTMMSVAALAGFGLSACKMDNPAFGETGASTGEGTSAESSDTQASDSAMSSDVSTSTGDGDGDAGEAEVSTSTSTTVGDGEGEVDTGDGDGDSTANDTDADAGDGDGDGDAGDGDGDGDACQTVYVDAIQDTFFMNALSDSGGEQSCQLGWTDWGPAAQTCAHLNFGGTGDFWVGEETGGEGVSYYALELDLPRLNQLPTGTITSASLVMPGWSGEPLPAGTSVWVRPFTPGDGASWEAGTLDGVEPEPSMPVATFKYQRYNTLTWDGANPLTEAPNEIGSLDIGGRTGEHSLVIPIDLAIVSTWALNAVGSVGNGLLVHSNAPKWEFLITSIDGLAQGVYLELQVCSSPPGP